MSSPSDWSRTRAARTDLDMERERVRREGSERAGRELKEGEYSTGSFVFTRKQARRKTQTYLHR
jgi:hypothetical protein